MSILSNITDTTPIAVQRSTRNFARGVFRVINNFVAAIIAERERQANLAILRNLSDRELWDIGIARSQIGAGLAEAAKERALLQKSLAEPMPSSGKVSGCCLNLSCESISETARQRSLTKAKQCPAARNVGDLLEALRPSVSGGASANCCMRIASACFS